MTLRSGTAYGPSPGIPPGRSMTRNSVSSCTLVWPNLPNSRYAHALSMAASQLPPAAARSMEPHNHPSLQASRRGGASLATALALAQESGRIRRARGMHDLKGAAAALRCADRQSHLGNGRRGGHSRPHPLTTKHPHTSSSRHPARATHFAAMSTRLAGSTELADTRDLQRRRCRPRSLVAS